MQKVTISELCKQISAGGVGLLGKQVAVWAHLDVRHGVYVTVDKSSLLDKLQIFNPAMTVYVRDIDGVLHIGGAQ